jgi:hypothetical protein
MWQTITGANPLTLVNQLDLPLRKILFGFFYGW